MPPDFVKVTGRGTAMSKRPTDAIVRNFSESQISELIAAFDRATDASSLGSPDTFLDLFYHQLQGTQFVKEGGQG